MGIPQDHIKKTAPPFEIS